MGLSWFSSVCLAGLSVTASALQVTGATGGVDPNTHARPFRYEINQFAQNGGPAWDLYILGMQSWQAVKQSNASSYFQIAGIHGWPIVDWDGVVGTNGRNYPGYCMHAAVTFPTWHRPYLALFEQLLVKQAMAIAQTYPSNVRAQYVNASSTLRIPYWDWAVNPTLPSSVTTTTITVNGPSGKVTIPNPLYQYNFQSTGTGNGFPSGSRNPVVNFKNTVRHYNSNTGQSNNAEASSTMQSNAANVLSLVYNLFTQTSDYTTFSCTYPGGRSNRANNLENIHNGIHNSLGGSPGHMSYPEVAGFDPIFWLHHANVDRYFAMWQALYPNSYIVKTTNAYGSYYEKSGASDSGVSTLAPFHSSNTTSALYSNDAVRSTAAFGYTYPELVDWGVSQTDLQNTVRAKVNQLYNPNASKKRDITIPGLNLDIKLPPFQKGPFSNVGLDLAKGLGINNLDNQWAIRLLLDRFAANNAFEICFFMGNPPSDASTWSTADNLIGTHAQFISADVVSAHPDGIPDGKLQGEISLTACLAAAQSRGFLSSIGIDLIVPLLRQNLQWRARSMVDGSEMDIKSIKGLTITVISQSVRPRKSISEFPTYGPVVEHPECTAGRDGKGG